MKSLILLPIICGRIFFCGYEDMTAIVLSTICVLECAVYLFRHREVMR